jgi:glycosyltransferase involved in cell wall biosynthesis
MTSGSGTIAGEQGISETALVSVVIPAYNGAATINETLRSVRSQTHTNLEIIVVDDGSTDATGVIAARHSALDPRLRIVRQANAGVAAARNHGWRTAASGLIAFVDADDLWSPDKIERQLTALRAMPEAGLVYSGYVIIDAASCITLQWEHTPHQGDVLRQLLIENFVGNGSAALAGAGRLWGI